MSIGVTLDVQFIPEMRRANYVMKCGLMGFAEVDNGKRIHRQPMTSGERQDLNRNVLQLGDFGQPLKLRTHHRPVAALPVQDRLVQGNRVFQRIVTSEELLTDEAGLQAPLDFPGRDGRDHLVAGQNLASVLLGLQESGNHVYLPFQDRGGLGL